MRCLTLAKGLRQIGADCLFVCRELEGNLIAKIRQEGFVCIALPILTDLNNVLYSDEENILLGSSLLNDEVDAIRALGAEKVDWLVVDHYAMSKSWEVKFRLFAKKIMVIDDLANREHDCDLLLDQNLVENFENRYHNLIPENCATFLGPEYALLQSEYADLYPRTPPRKGAVNRILVFMGGVDQHNLTSRIISAFITLNRKDIVLDVVAGSMSQFLAEIQTQAKPFENIKIHYNTDTLAYLVLKADLGIGGGGATSWERCCLGLPSIVITLAENQKPIASELHKRGLVRWLGHYDNVNEGKLLEALQEVINEPDLEKWSRVCMDVTKGKGVKRVSSVLMLNSKTKIKSRLVRLDDEELLLRWANESLVRENSFNQSIISAEQHKKWFYMQLRCPENCKFYVVETDDGIPVGQVRFQKNEKDWEIHYSLASFARGLGLARKFLYIAIQEFRITNKGAKVIGRVKEGNLPSKIIFEKLQFTCTKQHDGEVVFSHVV